MASFSASLFEAARQGVLAARENLVPMLILEGAMAALVAAYYSWSPGAVALAHFAAWQQAGGVLAAACATALAGGLLSEVSVVYLQHGGRWTGRHVENAGFKFGLFFVTGGMVYEFYRLQAVWFGHGTAWSVLVPKILVDQFAYTVIFSVPFQTIMRRWQVLRFSWDRLARELDGRFVTERILPVLVTSWMFWLPGVTLIYSMPSDLQTPLFIFATASWGLLLSAIGRPTPAPGAEALLDLVPVPAVAPQPND